jgi:hypothetical protein
MALRNNSISTFKDQGRHYEHSSQTLTSSLLTHELGNSKFGIMNYTLGSRTSQTPSLIYEHLWLLAMRVFGRAADDGCDSSSAAKQKAAQKSP